LVSDRLSESVPASTHGGASRALAAWGLGGFVVLGLPDGMLGTAWPSMRHTFHQPLSSLGQVLLCGLVGNLSTSVKTGALIRRFGVGKLLVFAGLIAAAGAALIAVAPLWFMVLIGTVFLGAASGLLDTGLNTVVALSGRLRLLNLLHGAYGVGAALGPLVITVAILWTSFRAAYVLLIGLELLMAYGWWRTGSHWLPEGTGPGVAAEAIDVPSAAALESERPHLKLLIALGVVVFFFYTGLEVTGGVWAASFFRGPLGLSAAAAGPAVFVYWGSLTLARFAIAIPKRLPNPVTLVRLGCAGGLVAAVLIWWSPSVPVVIFAFAVMGATFAPVFPSLVTLTPVRIGHERAHHAIGWQIAAANVGAAGISGIVGIVLSHAGLKALGPALLVLAVALVLCNAALEVLSRPTSRLDRYPDVESEFA
jgi:fucose permease